MTASRYAGQATITVPQDDGTTRPLGVPRVALALTAAITYQVREGDRLVPRIVLAAERGGFELLDVSVAEPTLETVFISLTGKELRD